MSIPTLLGLSALLHLYVGARLVPPLPGGWAPFLLAALLLISTACVPIGLLARRIARPPVSDRLAYAGLGFLGLFSTLMVLTVLRDLVLALAWAAQAVWPAFDRAAVARVSAAAVPLLGLGLTALGFFNARRTARVARVDVPIDRLPPGLAGFTIAQISDLHVGPSIRRPYVDRIVDAVNALDADVVAVTGDLVDGSVAELRPHVAPLARLKGRHGVYFVTGNHEYYAGAGPWLAEVERLGLQVLLNRHVVIEQGGERLVLAGVTDLMAHRFDESHRSDPKAALAGAPPDAGARLLLAHQPRSAAAAAAAGFDLQLSGHTHGGQFLPWIFFVRFQQPFTAGLHRIDRLRVYVSRGTGYWGPPKRLGAPSEITLIRLVPAQP